MTGTSPATASRVVAEGKAAVGAAVACYVIWGFLPLYFLAAARVGVGSFELLAERCVWSVLWALGLLLLSKQGSQAWAVLRQPRTLAWLMASAAVIATNWLVLILTVAAGHTLEVSLGYYINPLLNMAVGAALFRDRMDRTAMAAVALAAVGVAIQTAALGRVPIMGLALAATFCAYGVIRKRVAADAQTGLFIECLVLSFPGLAYTLWLQRSGGGHFGQSQAATTILLVSGPATALPLALFAWSARRMSLSSMGFIQFLSPTLVFFVGLATGETLSPLRAVSFVFIWAGVAVFIWSAWSAGRRAAEAAEIP